MGLKGTVLGKPTEGILSRGAGKILKSSREIDQGQKGKGLHWTRKSNSFGVCLAQMKRWGTIRGETFAGKAVLLKKEEMELFIIGGDVEGEV